MRKILRNMAKAQMKKMGADKINKRMRYNWRRVVGAYPTDVMTGEKIKEDYHGARSIGRVRTATTSSTTTGSSSRATKFLPRSAAVCSRRRNHG